MTTILSFLLIDWVFGIILALLTTFTIIAHEKESIGWANTWFILGATYILWKIDVLNIAYFKENWIEFLMYVGYYILFGVLWSVSKWFFYLYSLKKKFNKTKEEAKLAEAEYLKKNPNRLEEYGNEPNNKVYSFNQTLYNLLNYSDVQKLIKPTYMKINDKKYNNITVIKSFEIIPPLALNHKSKIISWISHWPIFVLWFIINDPIKKLINYTFDFIKGVYQNISNKLFKDIFNDIDIKQ